MSALRAAPAVADEPRLRRFEKSIAARTGLQLRPRERETLRDTLAARMASLDLRREDDYFRLLETGGAEAENEWDELAARLTNNESYFFRDRGQMTLLRERILPELIERHRELGRRTLRLWCAGCSTGEETYSLAMLVDELLPRRASGSDWEVVILGTDIDEQALEKARRGIYPSWSFRTMEPAARQRYFHRRDDGWHVSLSIRSGVTFAGSNLVRDPFPSATTGIHDMDLILCRNVFIYFEHGAVAAVLPKFARTLREGGYLMTGHGEARGLVVEPLQTRMFPESVVYQRVKQASGHVAIPPPLPPRPPPPPPRAARGPAEKPAERSVSAAAAAAPKAPPVVAHAALTTAGASYAAGDYEAVVAALRPLLEQAASAADDEPTLLLLAHAQANLGRYEAATSCCERLMKAFPFAAAPSELLAAIAQEQGRYDDAKTALKKALYLAPTSPTPYLELGALYEREGDAARARKMRVTALELLETLPEDATLGIAAWDDAGPTVGEWTRQLKRRLAEGE